MMEIPKFKYLNLEVLPIFLSVQLKSQHTLARHRREKSVKSATILAPVCCPASCACGCVNAKWMWMWMWLCPHPHPEQTTPPHNPTPQRGGKCKNHSAMLHFNLLALNVFKARAACSKL